MKAGLGSSRAAAHLTRYGRPLRFQQADTHMHRRPAVDVLQAEQIGDVIGILVAAAR